MIAASRSSYREPTGNLEIEYDRRIGYFSMPSDHLHEHYELYCLLEGERIYFINDRSYRVQAGDLVFVNRHAVHKTLDSGRPDHERIVFYFTAGLFTELGVPEDLMERIKEPFNWDIPMLRLPGPEQEHVQRRLLDMISEMNHPQAGSSLLLKHWFLELMLYAYRNQINGRVRTADADPVLHPKTQAIVRYINEHFSEDLQLTDVASAFKINPHYLSRLFKQTTGFTFSDYVNVQRIKEAQRLLRESDLSITEIAWQAGYSNFSHFGKTFKRTVHMSPREYRRQSRSGGF